MKCPKCQSEYQAGDKFCRECGTKLPYVCPQCGHEVSSKDKFCPECGTDLVNTQNVSQKVTAPSLEDLYTKLQRSMPQSLAEKIQSTTDTEGENRILSILFADVTNSVAITENMPPEDSADLISECLKSMTDPILKHGGFINRYLGDSVLAFFGIPETHENDTERAILSALEMQDAVAKLNLSIKISINTGMVYVGAIGPDSHSEFTAMGTAVNLSARLKDVAEPGQILVGETTYRSTRRSFEFQPLPLLTVKGISEPVHAYEVIKPLPKPEKIRGIEGIRSEMIGRDREFSELKECVDELLAGKGQIVSIIGEAGVGKSRLVSELKSYLNKIPLNPPLIKGETAEVGLLKGETGESETSPLEKTNTNIPPLEKGGRGDLTPFILEGRCVSIGESVGYWVFIDILRSYLEFSGQDSLDDRKKKIIDKMQSLFPQRWEEVVPYIGNLLSIRFDNEWDEKIRYLPPEQIKYQTFLTLRDFFLTLAQQNPLLLIFEDLHWADNLSLDMINLLMDILTISPLMILCIYRPEKEHKSWHIGAQASAKCLDRYTEITLKALTQLESRKLVESLLKIENLSETVRDMILQKAEGNPFFVEEVIRSLIESGVVYRDDEKWVAKSEIEGIAVPDTIQSVIMARIDRLEEEVRYILQSASVIGRLFRHKLLQYTTQQEHNLDKYLGQLEDRELIYEEQAIPEMEYSFWHVLTQETAYNTILSRRKKEFHRKVAEGYESLYSDRIEQYYEELAYHYGRSDNKDKALHYLVKAGDKSKESFANEESIRYYNQALKLMDEGVQLNAPTIGHIYQSLGEIYFPLTRHEEALECLRKALEHTSDKKRRARIYGTMGWIYQRELKHNLALEHLNAGIAELGDDTESPEMAMIYIPLYWVTQDIEEKRKIALRGLKMVEGTEYSFQLVGLYNCVIIYFCDIDIGKSFEYARKSVEVAQRSGNSYLIALSTQFLGHVHWENGERDLAIKLASESIEIYRKIGHAFGICQTFAMLSRIYWGRDDWDAAIECYERSLEVITHPSAFAGEFMNVAHRIAWIYLQRGDTQKAMGTCKMALDYTERLGMDKITQNLAVLDEVYLIMGKHEEFVSYCRKLREEKGESIKDLKLTQWYLEPAILSGLFTQNVFVDEFDSPNLKPEWEWVNLEGNSSHNLSDEASCLEIRASGSSCPCLLKAISEDFAVEVKLVQTKTYCSGELPSVGGLLVWKDEKNFLRFEKGMHLEDEISLSGRMQGTKDYFGRGMLASDVAYLRLERIGDIFSAYCSDDGANWMTCGQVNFPAEDPIQVGIHAIGNLGLRSRYTPNATATRFDYFKIYGPKQSGVLR